MMGKRSSKVNKDGKGLEKNSKNYLQPDMVVHNLMRQQDH